MLVFFIVYEIEKIAVCTKSVTFLFVYILLMEDK